VDASIKRSEVENLLVKRHADAFRLAYIEGEMEKRRGMSAPEATKPEPFDPQAELYKISDKYNVQARKIKEAEEGNVTNSLGMLTSIPEVDLGME
jgi:hypothetical protein